MVVENLQIEMQPSWQFSQSITVEIKSHIVKKLGREKAEMYFNHLEKFLGFKISKLVFDELCYGTLGRENLALHNLFIRSILKNAYLANAPPSKRTNTGHSRNSTVSNGYLSEMILASPRKERSVNSRFRRVRDRPSPLGPYGKVHTGIVQDGSNSCDIQKPQEFLSIGSKALLEMGSVEDGEEVEQVRGSPGVQSRSPVRVPLGILTSIGGVSHKHSRTKHGTGNSLPVTFDTCYNCSELPDTGVLRKWLEHRLELEGLGLSIEFVDLLNNGLDAYLKRLIKHCMELARSRCNGERMKAAGGRLVHDPSGTQLKGIIQKSNQSCSASLLDFQVAMELNPLLLGEEWPVQLEKICLSEFR